jgi:hypothetical protein
MLPRAGAQLVFFGYTSTSVEMVVSSAYFLPMKKLLISLLYIALLTGCNPYGKKLEGTPQGKSLYYPASVPKENVELLFTFLDELGFFKGRKEIQLCRDGNQYILKLPIAKDKEHDEDFLREVRFQTCCFPEKFSNHKQKK